MKYIVVLGDGMADYPKGELGFRTPLELARKPSIDSLAKRGTVGLIRTVAEGMNPGSDVANLGIMGYDPKKYYTGRSSLEAVGIGIDLAETDTAFRMNLVTLSGEGAFPDKIMEDYSAGEITTPEAHELVAALKEKLSNGCMEFYGGTSYRNAAVLKGDVRVGLTPPHDITGKRIGDYLPEGEGADVFRSLMERSIGILSCHPVNLKRKREGKNTADAVWFWGAGKKPSLPEFSELYRLKGAVITAVDLLRGIALSAKMDVINVEGATGNLDTNFEGKAKACVDALDTRDFVYLHMEAPDECGHKGDAKGKIEAIEKIDGVVNYVVSRLEEKNEAFCIAVLPDHATPLCVKTHVSDPVPYLVYNSLRPQNSGLKLTEEEGQKGLYLNNAGALIKMMLKS